MKKDTTALLSELLKNHPELKKHKKELETVIQKFLESRPDSTIDAAFREQLREEILAHCSKLASDPKGGWGAFMRLWWKPFLAGTVSMAAAFLILPQLQTGTLDMQESRSGTNLQSLESDGALMKKSVGADEGVMEMVLEETSLNTELEEGAFGALEFPEDQLANPRTQSGGAAYGRGGGGGGMGMPIMPPQDPYGKRINYEYVYEGDIPELSESAFVYHKKKDVWDIPFDGSRFNVPQFDFINIKALKDLKMNGLSFVESGKMGYSINFNFEYPSISLYQNYPMWQDEYQIINRCHNGYCPGPQPLKEEDMLEDREIIRLAKNFLDFYGMEYEFWGTPTVKKYWEEPAYQGTKPDFFPDELQVFYPYVVDGKPLVDRYGNELGSYVSVNLRIKKVTSASLEPFFLESSKYEVNSKEEILKMAKQGGNQGFAYASPDETITLQLEEPTLQLTLLQKYDKNHQIEDEYYVPSLVFPIQRDEEENPETREYYYQTRSVVVPLVKDIQKK